MLGWAAVQADTVTPEKIKAIFDAQAIFILIAVGAVVKYVPWFATVRNHAIGWVNLAAYILGRLVLPGEAHAGMFSSLPDAVGVLIGGIANAGWAQVAYETFGRSLLEKLLKLKKVPHPADKLYVG